MMKFPGRALIIVTLLCGGLCASNCFARDFASVQKGRDILLAKDYLGFRVFLKRSFPKIKDADEWLALRSLVLHNSDHIGYDLLYAFDRHPYAGISSGPMDINQARANADALLLSGRFEDAFSTFQKIAVELKRLRRLTRSEQQREFIDFLNPFIFHSMARALYGAKRFDEAYIVLRWIPQTYPRIRQVQFEKMWSAFRGGRIDHALGALASQSSSYFTSYLSPEAYLVQTYLYKKLCRDEDYNQVLRQMRGFNAALKNGKFGVEDFAKSDLETLVMWRLTLLPESGDDSISRADRENERDRIKASLARIYAVNKGRLQDDMEKALAYVQLTVRSGASNALKAVEKLPDRNALYSLGLEIWPSTTQEEWIDEIGTHRFVGESMCKN